MEWLDKIRRRRAERPTETPTTTPSADPTPTPPSPASPPTRPSFGEPGDARWYVPAGGDLDRFRGPDGGPPGLHLIDYRDTHGERVLRLCEDSTGLLVGPTDRRLSRVGIHVSQLRGEGHYRGACNRGDFRPGRPVRLVREPDNKYDPNAVAITEDADGAKVAAYVNKGKARTLARLIDSGADLRAISIRGTGPREACPQIAVLVASPEVIEHLLSPRPKTLPRPAHLVR